MIVNNYGIKGVSATIQLGKNGALIADTGSAVSIKSGSSDYPLTVSNLIASGTVTGSNLSGTNTGDSPDGVGPLTKPVITNNGNGTINVTSVQANLFSLPAWEGTFSTYTIPAVNNLALTDNSVNLLVIDYNSGSPIYNILNTESSNGSSIFAAAMLWRIGTEIHSIPLNWGLSTASRLNDRSINQQRFVRTSGLMLSESTGRVITITNGLVWVGITALSQASVDSATNGADFWYHSGGLWTRTLTTTYNNTQYDNGTDLVSLASNKYGVVWVYRYVNNTSVNKIAYVLGNTSYTANEAIVATVTPVPPILVSQAILVGKIIIQNGTNVAYSIASAFTTSFAGTTILDHDSLAGLQGGIAAEYYHLTSSEYTGTGTGTFVRSTSPAISGNPTTTTQTQGDNSTRIATTAYVDTGLNTKLNLTTIVDTKDYTGFVDADNINVSYDHTTRTITLTGADLSYYFRGTKHILTSPWTSPAHTATTGKYFLYSTDGSTFSWSTTAWTFADVMVSYVDYDTVATASFAFKETHACMDYKSHEEFHANIGTYRVSGGGATAGTYVENNPTDANVSPGFNAAVIKDEDVSTTLPAWTEGTYTTVYVGVGGTVVFNIAATLPFISTGSYLQVNNTTTGVMANGVNARYYNVYQIMLPCTSDTNSARYRMLMLQPQATYTSLAAAQAEDTRTLVLGNLTTLAAEMVIYTRITYVTASGDTNTGKCRIATGGISYVAGSRAGQINITGFTTNNHTALSNLTWTTSGHIGSPTVVPAFDASGLAIELAETGTGNIVLSASPTLTGIPLAPTAAIDNNSTQIATTAYVDVATMYSRVKTTAIVSNISIGSVAAFYALKQIMIVNNTANSVIVNVGTTSTGTEIAGSILIDASGYAYLPTPFDTVFSINSSTTIYISSASWNSSNLTTYLLSQKTTW